jgi:hypothetical protein
MRDGTGVGRSVELDKHVGTMVISPHSIQSQFDQLWGVIEQYRAAHPPHPPPEAEGPSIPPPQFNVSVITTGSRASRQLVGQVTGGHDCGAGAADRCVGTLVSDGSCVCYHSTGK